MAKTLLRFVLTLTACAFALCPLPPPARACTTFALRQGGRVVYGNNYDWSDGAGLVLVNKRNVSKSALPTPEGGAARWVSKYGSVTFNQYGRELPASGMNEAGLVVMLMWLDETTYPAADGRGAVNPLEWIQYQLDNFGSVKEVVQNAPSLRVSSSLAKVHYLVGDREGAAAAVEFLGGRLVVHSGEKLPVPVLTNDTYAGALLHLKKYSGFGGALPLPEGQSSLARFVRASALTKDYKPAAPRAAVADAFEILSNVSQGNYTKWGIVYDPRELRVHFRTLKSPGAKRVDAGSFDFGCAAAVKVLDVNHPGAGDVRDSFFDYEPGVNESLVRSTFRSTALLRAVPESYLRLVWQHPQGQTCRR